MKDNNDPKTKVTGLGIPMECVKLIFEQFGIVAITDVEGRYLYVNKRWEKDTGISREEAIGKFGQDTIEGSRAISAMRSGQTISGNMILRTSSGKLLPGIISYMPVYNKDNVVGCFISSGFLSIKEASDFAKKLDRITKDHEFLKSEMKKRSGARYSLNDIIGESDAIKHLKELIYTIGASDASVLIEGETGTGKELVAHSIHNCSSRSIFPFVKVNCSAIPANLMESEFFGYDEGSFTGALSKGKKGKFEMADMGSLFLDEINHLSTFIQPKLLRVLQEKEIERIGRSDSIPIDVRIISASNHSLRELIEKGEFREDLFYRLNIIQISIPPLRERKEDIPLLINDMVKNWNKNTFRPIWGVTDDAMAYLMERDWPGNIRELMNVFERAASISIHEQLNKESFEGNRFQETAPTVRLDMEKDGDDTTLYSLQKRRGLAEREMIIDALDQCNNNKSMAAEMLNISRTLLYRKLKKYKL